ncbi:phenylalanine--tRNA ligase subunit beta, partial [Candidatus Saccharibacteria bacterium]|nr:phenylalanine--tRNA ligase subunit beta [Candidatus Saccharibacteria bacterium]
MKVSLQLANLYSSADLLSINQDELIHKIGTQLGAIEEIINIEDVYKGVLVAKIIKCHKHPNADSLNVCMIDDGKQAKDVERDEQGLVQVVCGAPNVKEGLTVAWIPPGSVVPSTVSKDPFVLGKRELRGIVSNGMLASASELAISDDHQGILQIEDNDNQQVVAGKTFADLYSLKDLIIDCENKMFTHRPDCFGILGVARELAGIAGLPFKSPDWYSPKAIIAYQDSGKLSIDSKNEIPEKVKRFMVQVVEDITVKPSTIQRQSWLTRLDNRPINNIVDATNFYMQLTAQPTHAFDYDKVKQLCADPARVCIFPRMAKDGETLELLNGKTIKLTTEDVVIATDKHPIALAGVMGGVATEVDSNTKNIIVECATFDMYTIRRTSMRHGLFTDAVTRFNKGQSHLQNAIVLSKLVDDICEQSDGTAGRLFDSLPEASLLSWSPVLVNINFINKRLGSSLS